MQMRHWQGAALLAAGWMMAGALPAAAATAAATTVATPEAEAAAPASTSVSSDDAFNFFLQEAEVVTASRRAQKKSDSPVAIDVITREEIQRSGALNIWDILRMRVGVDMTESQSIEGNPIQFNVRGLASEFSQSLQVLIDGRSVVSGANSGIFWRNLPIALDDIERIEIVRGPNSALFGANAGQGVINIITRKPVGGGRGDYKAEAGQNGLLNTSVSLDLGSETAAHRISYFQARQGTDPKPSGDNGVDLSSTDFDQRINGRSELRLWEGGELSLYGGLSQRRFKVPNPVSTVNTVAKGEPGSNSDAYAMLHLLQHLNDQSIELTLSRKQLKNEYGSISVGETVDDGDLLGHLSLLDGKSVSTLGGSLRFVRADSQYLFNYGGIGGGSDTELNRQGRAYAAESLSLADWLNLSLAASMESSDLGGQWPAYQGAVILKPLDGHSLRLSASRSPGFASLQNSRSNIIIKLAANQALPGGLTPNGVAGSFPVGIVVDGGSVQPSQISSYEATWTSSLFDRHLTAEITAFQMEVDGYIELQTKTPPFSTGAGKFVALDNGSFALIPSGAVWVDYTNQAYVLARGTETVLTYKPTAGSSIQVNHTYEDVYYNNPSDANDPFIKDVTPWNKVNLIASLDLPWGLNVAGNVGWTGRHYSYLASRYAKGWIEDQAKVDLRLGYSPAQDVELYAVGINLDHAFRTEGFDGTAQPQMYYGGVNVAWGGK